MKGTYPKKNEVECDMDNYRYMEGRKDLLYLIYEKVIGDILDATAQLCIELIQMERQYIPNQHWKKILLPLHPQRLKILVYPDIFLGS